MTVGSLLGHLARRFHQLSTALFDLEMRRSEIDLTPVQYAALVAVEDNPAIDQATLASLIAYDRTTIGGVVDRLVDKHLVTRTTSENDRRSKVLTATETGRATIQNATLAVLRAQQQLVGGLDSEEAEELVRLLDKAISALGEVNRTSHRSRLDQAQY